MAKQKHVVVSEKTHQILSLYKSSIGAKTLEEVIIKVLELDSNYDAVKKLATTQK